MPRKPKFIGRDARGRPVYRFRRKTYRELPAMCKAGCNREAIVHDYCWYCAGRMGLR